MSVDEELPDLTLLARGKVRDVYQIDNHQLLFVATDRISAFDVVMKSVSLLNTRQSQTRERY
jgi:phosphoribosylaminoimidazole-succinocarboxamide synthase